MGFEVLLTMPQRHRPEGDHHPSTSTTPGTTSIRLLRDLRTVFGGKQKLATATILNRLHDLEEAPWGDLRGKRLDARGLAWRLGHYEIKSTKVKIDGRALQGYRLEDQIGRASCRERV